ncbi:MAG: hypothetical protein M1820_007466 [Bogoriella megaspora]|nr:MAG: hypothetical protein M1820_007466 [Bogoriella megaspora]
MQNLGLRHGEGQVPYQQYAWAVPGVADNIIPRKRRGNLPREATQYFKRWFNEHISSPYPTEEEKVHFVNVSGLTMAQVGNWFINQRRRNPMTKEKRISANQHHNQSESDEDEEEEEEE